MTASLLIRLLSTFPPDAECVIELLDGTTSVPIQGAVQYQNSANPRQVHLLTSTLSVKELPSITATDYHGNTTEFHAGMKVMHVTDDGQIFPGTISNIEDGLLEITFPDDEEGWEKPSSCYPG